ncbi:MAG: hypothetical protein WEC15_03625 [Flavobacteriales bacterium]
MKRLQLLVWTLGVLLNGLHLSAQVPVPFTSKDGRFMVFANGRFEKLEPREPQWSVAQEGRVIYLDHEGRLRVFHAEGRRLYELGACSMGNVKASRNKVAWTVGDTLKTLSAGKAKVVATGVERFSVSDSLVVYHDSARHELNVLWRSEVLPIAEVEQGTEAPQWSVGTNTLTFFDRSTFRLFLFHRGKLRVLADSTDLGMAVNGEDLVGYWNSLDQQWKVLDSEREDVLSDMRPISAKAGRRMIAFVDGTGRLKCYSNGIVHTLSDTIPTDYWMQDDVLLYLQGGSLMIFQPTGSMVVERYVPERWQVWGDRLVYLDINRELRGIEEGVRVRYGNEAAIPRFDLFGDAVMYPSPTGLITVIRDGRKHLY